MMDGTTAGNDRVIRIALCQYDFLVGDIDGNLAKIRSKLAEVKALGVDLAVFPELTLSGYPPEDLLLKPHFAEGAASALHALASEARDIVAVVGFPDLSHDLYNAAGVLADGRGGGHLPEMLPAPTTASSTSSDISRGGRKLWFWISTESRLASPSVKTCGTRAVLRSGPRLMVAPR